jgi:hypothetical protein
MKNVVTQHRQNGFAYAVMAGWMLETETFGGDHHWLVLSTGAALFTLLSYREFRAADQLRRDEQAREW